MPQIKPMKWMSLLMMMMMIFLLIITSKINKNYTVLYPNSMKMSIIKMMMVDW